MADVYKCFLPFFISCFCCGSSSTRSRREWNKGVPSPIPDSSSRERIIDIIVDRNEFRVVNRARHKPLEHLSFYFESRERGNKMKTAARNAF